MLKLLITCEYFVHSALSVPDYQFLLFFVNTFWNIWKKTFGVGVFRKGLSGYSKHN